jgi:hypothetical protein
LTQVSNRETVQDALRALEPRRRKVVRDSRIVTGVSIAGIAGTVIGFFSQGGEPAPFVFIAFLIGGARTVVNRMISGPLRKDAKHLVIAALAAERSLSFDPDPEEPATEPFRRHRLVPAYDRAKYEDGLSGSFEGARWKLREAHLQSKSTDSKGRARYSTVFRGQLIAIDLPRAHATDVLIQRDRGIFNRFSNPAEGWQRIGLGDGRFERAFEVFARDQVEARTLLTPTLMEELIDLENAWGKAKLRAILIGDTLLIALSGGNMFEIGSLSMPLDDASRIESSAREIEALEHLIATFSGPLSTVSA